MSVELVKIFFGRMKSDQEFAAKVNELKTAEEVKKFIDDAGFDFNQEEFAAVCEELTDTELDQVNGGLGITICPLVILGIYRKYEKM